MENNLYVNDDDLFTKKSSFQCLLLFISYDKTFFTISFIFRDVVKESKKDKSGPAVAPPVQPEAKKVPSELKCPMCNNLLTDAVLIPCCGTSYCDDCKFS